MREIETPVRVVFDCMIFVQAAARSGGPANACLESVRSGHAKLFLSPSVIAEIEDVLSRSKIRRRFTSLSDKVVEAFLTNILDMSVLIEDVSNVFQYPRDPKDEKYIDLAVKANANALVTRDNDLLDLMTGTDLESKQFRQRFRNLKIVKPDEFLRIISESELPLDS